MKSHFIYRILLIFLLFGGIQMMNAQAIKKNEFGVSLTVQSTEIEIQLYGSSTVRIVKHPANNPYHKESLSVIKHPQPIRYTSTTSNNIFRLNTGSVFVEVNLSDGHIIFKNSKDFILLKEESNGTSFLPFNDAGSATFTVSQSFMLDGDESIYGLGQQQQGKLSQRNVKLTMIQGNTDDYVPFFVSSKGYGLFWDNYSPTIFEDTPSHTVFKSDVGDCIDYYFMSGAGMDESIACMRDLTGQVPMFPLWTYGFWQSKERYKSQQELVGVVHKYRDLKVPLDGIIQDWQYWGNNYLWNAMDFLNPEFPEPQKMVDDIHQQNAHIIISIWNSFGPMTRQYREMEPKGMLMNFQTWPQSGLDKWPPDMNYPSGVKPYDPYHPEARDIYWRYLNKGLFSLGMDGWWIDSSEPDHHSFKPSDLDNKTFLGSFRKVRNAFPLMTVGGVAEHQRKQSSDKRVFILTRSAFAGQQRYGANTWSGDVNSSWESLRNQIPAGLNFTLSGIPYWNSDIGGFFAGVYNKRWSDGSGSKNPLYQELYVRWLQFGCFTPMMRSHGTDVPREIYNFGVKGEPVYDAIEKSIRLRYLLLPYIYSTAWKVTNKQYSFMRALIMDFARDNKAAEIKNEYMFGSSLLVAPIVTAQYTPETIVKTDEATGWDKNSTAKSSTSQVDFTQNKSTSVYLPSGVSWYDFWTGERLSGGQQFTRSSTIDRVPFFVKAGSILPLGPDVQYATEKNWETLQVRIYPGANGQFTLYEDENDNYNYEKGNYSTIAFNWNEATRTLTIDDRKGNFANMLIRRRFNISIASTMVNGMNMEHVDKQIIYIGKKMSVKF